MVKARLPQATVDIRQVSLNRQDVLTIYIKGDASRAENKTTIGGHDITQVEIRLTPQGKLEIFHNSGEMTIARFDDWRPMEDES